MRVRDFCLFLLSFLLLGFSNPNSKEKVQLVGSVGYLGNEPFSYLAFCSKDLRVSYRIEDEDMIKVLEKEQYGTIEVVGEVCPSTKNPYEKCIKIKKWKRIQTEE